MLLFVIRADLFDFDPLIISSTCNQLAITAPIHCENLSRIRSCLFLFRSTALDTVQWGPRADVPDFQSAIV